MIGRLDPRNFGISLEEGSSMVGGGALPLLVLPTCLISLAPKVLSAHVMETWLRSFDPPIITRVEKDQVLLDVRTIHEKELKTVARAVKEMAGI